MKIKLSDLSKPRRARIKGEKHDFVPKKTGPAPQHTAKVAGPDLIDAHRKEQSLIAILSEHGLHTNLKLISQLISWAH